MGRVIKLSELDLTKLVKKIIMENDDEFGMSKFNVEPHVKMQPREKELESLFGKYDEQIPADILRYMRKNPQLIMNRLAKIYGDKFLDYAEKAHIKQERYNF
jgi:hypothetical protein